METFLIRLLQFILAISLLVLLHEGGHMFFSKLFGVRVEKFFIFFDISIGKWTGKIFSWKPKKDDTEYGMGWLPLGGYCKISGMIDESMDTEQMKQPPQPWEFRTKPAWQRLLIMIGGVLVNFFLALFIYSMVMFTWGESYYKVGDMKMGMVFNDEAKALGFRDGDVLLGTEEGEFKEMLNVNGDFFRQIAKAHRVDIVRDGKPMSLSLPGDLDMLQMIKNRPVFCVPFIPSVIDSIAAGGPADKLAVVLTPELRMGIFKSSLATYYKPTQVHYSFLESFPAGVKYGWNVLRGYVSNFKYLASADGAKSIGGFAAIGSLFPPYWDWHLFWNMTAFLSIILAFMNILPIPALDGGHVVFLLYEMITRRKPSEKFMIWAEYVGFAIVGLLMIVANLNDILRWLGWM